jgi:hypothetical protein
MRVSHLLAATALAVLAPALLTADDDEIPPYAKTIDLSGPRVGVSFLSPGVVEKLEGRSIHAGNTISQFGWQFEKRFYAGAGGLTGVTEWILLLGGFEHGLVLPSANWLVGLRTRSGAEFGAGPNISPAGTGIVIAVGNTFRAGALNVPVNLAVVPSAAGLRVTMLVGFNTRR